MSNLRFCICIAVLGLCALAVMSADPNCIRSGVCREDDLEIGSSGLSLLHHAARRLNAGSASDTLLDHATRLHGVPAPVLAQDRYDEPICLDGKVLPRLYVLGHQKCASTTTTSEFAAAGAISILGSEKAPNMLTRVCGFKMMADIGPEHLNGTALATMCLAISEAVKLQYFGETFWPNCSSFEHKQSQRTLMDGSPINARIPGLPRFLSDLYGGDAARVVFVISIREPLSRMQSAWYYMGDKNEHITAEFPSFSSWAKAILPTLKAYNQSGWVNMSLDYGMDIPYRSMYSLNVEPWLQAFQPRQFVIIPMHYFTGSSYARDATMDMMAEKFNVTLRSKGLGDQVIDKNVKPHPSLEEDLSVELRTKLMHDYFGPDQDRFAAMLATAMKKGLTVAGYSGTADASEIRAYLQASM